MKKVITINNKEIEYTLRVSKRSRSVRVAVYCDGAVVVTKPFFVSQGTVERFISDKAEWVLSKIEYFSRLGIKVFFKNTRAEYGELKNKARLIAMQKVVYWNQQYGFSYNRISIKNQKSRWGSCSKKGNLNFNYKIALLPEKLVDYIVIHELCHLGEFNHSKKFWNLVEKAAPDYQNSRNELKKIGIRYANG